MVAGTTWFEPDARLTGLADNLTFVEQIEKDIARIKTRREHVDDGRLRRLVMADIARLKARRVAELLRIVRELRGHDDLRRRLDLVFSVPGIGERTALALLIRMPELGRVSREAAAALAGLAPFDRDAVSSSQPAQLTPPRAAAVKAGRRSSRPQIPR